MGRHRKFRIGEVVWHDGPAVAVDYRQDGRQRGSYRLLRLLHLPGGKPYGPARWVQSYQVDATDWPTRRWTAVKTYRANQRLGGSDRGCVCECCAHQAIPTNAIRSDGTLVGEEAT